LIYINVDPDYPDHPKTKRLVGLLGRGAEILPIKLWCYCGKYHAENGRFTGYSPQEIESIVNWWGKYGEMVDAMVKVGFLVKCEDGDYKINDWNDHEGHVIVLKERGQKGAKARWDKERLKLRAASNNPDECLSNASSNAQAMLKQYSRPDQTRPDQTKEVGIVYVDFEKSTLTNWNLFCDKYPTLSKITSISDSRRKSLKKRFSEGKFIMSEILTAIEEQPFLTNGNPGSKEHSNWRVNFDWLIKNDTNYLKVLERKYVDGNANAIPESLKECM
jgi:hypothetical protein